MEESSSLEHQPSRMTTSQGCNVRQVHANGLLFDVALAGPADGPSVVLLHGFPASMVQWEAVAARLAADGYRVVTPNLRGYSRGARPQGVIEYTIDKLVGDVVGLLDALEIDQAHLVAHDWGGIIGWFVAVEHPERVVRLTAVSTPHPRAVLEAALSDPAQREKMAYITTLRQVGSEAKLRADDWSYLFQACVDLPRDVFLRHVALLDEPGALTGAVNYYRAYRPDAAADLGTCNVPVRFVWGRDDMAFGRTAAERTSKFVAGAYDFVEFDGGHWIPDLAPQELVQWIEAEVR